MILTEENYFSESANMKYFGSSQYKAFSKCEEKALAELQGRYIRQDTTALLVGSYVDAHFSGNLDLFRAKHPEIFKRDGDLKAEYKKAEDIIYRIERDPLFSMLLSGEKQAIRIGEISGVPVKIKMDSYLTGTQCEKIVESFPETAEVFGFCDGAIVDLKIVKDFEAIYDPSIGCRVPWIQYWGYDTQGAIYQHTEGHQLPYIIAAATKEPEINLELFHIPQAVLDARMAEIEEMIPHYEDVKRGRVAPDRCGDCDWCGRTKKLKSITEYEEVAG